MAVGSASGMPEALEQSKPSGHSRQAAEPDWAANVLKGQACMETKRKHNPTLHCWHVCVEVLTVQVSSEMAAIALLKEPGGQGFGKILQSGQLQ